MKSRDAINFKRTEVAHLSSSQPLDPQIDIEHHAEITI